MQLGGIPGGYFKDVEGNLQKKTSTLHLDYDSDRRFVVHYFQKVMLITKDSK